MERNRAKRSTLCDVKSPMERASGRPAVASRFSLTKHPWFYCAIFTLLLLSKTLSGNSHRFKPILKFEDSFVFSFTLRRDTFTVLAIVILLR
jgi:hypothetical protein